MCRWAVLLLFVFLASCSAPTKVVRLDTGLGAPRVHVPRRDVEPVEVSEEAFKEAVAKHAPWVPAVDRPLEYARQVLGVPERSGWYQYERRSQQLIPSSPGSGPKGGLSPEDEELKRRYLEWCAQEWEPGDCLRLLVDKPFLDGDDRYALAMAIAHSKVLGAMKEELSRMVSPQAVAATVVAGMTMYAILLALPEPVTKGIAALLTLGAGAYLGWDTVWRLMDGWLVLMKEVDRATSFDELYAAGAKFGEVMGEKAARAFVMLATVAVGNTTAGMAAKMPTLPGAGQAAAVAKAQMNIRFTAPALAQVESVAISAQGVTIALAPTAVAMMAGGNSSGKAGATTVPPRSSGPGEWAKADEHMSEQARRYQAQVTGAPEGYVYRVQQGNKTADFDGFDQGVLIEAKGTGYAQWVDENLNFVKFFEGRNQLLEQATRQLNAAKGMPVRWIVAEEKLAGALKKLFKNERLAIEVIHVPPVPTRGGTVQ
jgi:hypothetical protein